VDNHVQRTESSIGANIGFVDFVDRCQVYLTFRKGNSVQTRPACHPHRLASGKAIGAYAKHEDVGLFAPCKVHTASRANRKDSGVADVYGKLLDAKPARHMKLRNLWRRKLEWFEDVPGNFDVGMMLEGPACGGWALRCRYQTRCEQNR
jgi:hypothetical protein